MPRNTPTFNIPREVDCISGCAILIRRSFWQSAGGFDPRYSPAYYEDYDLMMTARAHKMSVFYQPKSEIIHFEHKTCSTVKNKYHIYLSNQNKQLFLNKWHKILNRDHLLLNT